MFTEAPQKVRPEHLRRDAFLYVRQSTLRQVFENTESSQRQYALRERAVALGWPIERIRTIDSDLGISGAHAENRDGFQHLVSEVALGHAGIVLGLEVSRLAQQRRLAPLARTRSAHSHADPGRGWRLRSGSLQRSAVAGPEGNDERVGAACTQGAPSRWTAQQSAAWRACGGAACRSRLRPAGPCHPRPGSADPTSPPAAL